MATVSNHHPGIANANHADPTDQNSEGAVMNTYVAHFCLGFTMTAIIIEICKAAS